MRSILRVFNMSNLKRYTLYVINLADVLAIFMAYALSYFVRFVLYPGRMGSVGEYHRFLMIVLVVYVIINFTSLYKSDDFLKRSVVIEAVSVVKMTLYMLAITAVYFNFAKINIIYSRVFEGFFFGTLPVFSLLLRYIFKKVLIHRYRQPGSGEKVVILTDSARAETLLNQVNNGTDWRYSVAGFVLTDNSHVKNIGGIRVIANKENMFDKLSTTDYDAILIDTEDASKEEVSALTQEFFKAGKIIHMGIRELQVQDVHRFLDNVGDVQVVTYRMVSPMSRRQLLAKRILNVLFALLLFIPFLVLWLVAAVFTTLESPGPILVPRVRVGRNNTRFYQYRFRVFRVDARERVAAGKMPYTLIGRIYRALHFDGAPMILNILVGEMGFIGPKAPNLAKYLEMSVKERNLLMAVPGVIGYWSVERDHEHLVEDEKGYIEDWSLFKDVMILVLTGLRYITHQSLRFDGVEHMREEYAFTEEIKRRRIRLPYDRSLWTKRPNLFYLFIKRVFDICVSLFAIIILSPVYLILAVLITSDDGGKPFYSHMRIGKDGRRFALYKFRSMRMDAGNLEDLLTPEQLEQYRKEFKIDEDPRITPIGNFIRKTSLDELPQFFNILFGDMSLIGPRPLVEKEVQEKYTEEQQAKLLSATPGVTGYWQAYARNNATYETDERQQMEMYYIEHQSLWLDIKIFFKTFISVIQKEGAK